MRIAVCVKQVPLSDQVEIDADTHQMIRVNTEMTVNPADLNALTVAIQMKKSCGGSVDVFTMGNANAKSALVTAIAMGADEGYLVTDRSFAGGDSLGTARVLAKAIESQGNYDLILCGSLSSDGATGQVGPMIAQIMDLPSITEVKEILSVDESDKIEVYKSWKGKYLHLRTVLPAMVSISLGSNVPILPTLRNQMKARKKELHEITNAELLLTEKEIGLRGAKSIVTDTMIRQDSGKRSIFLEGTTQEQAKQILELLGKAGD